MKLNKLTSGIPDLKIQGDAETKVKGLALDSRRVVPGAMFFAMPGLRTDGHLFVEEAIDRGAVAIVSEKDCWVPPHVALVLVSDIHRVVGEVASRFYYKPQKNLQLTGVLGTSGKTVVASLLKHFQRKDQPVGLLGTISYEVGKRSLPATRTTPEPIELYALLAQIRDHDCAKAILEISSHGIDQHRLEGIQFHHLVLMNLSPEHLNYHGSLEKYVALEQEFIISQAKKLNRFIAGIDDDRVRAIVSNLPDELQQKTLTFGCSADADIRADEIAYSEKDTRFQLTWPGGAIKLVSPLLGEFNLQNSLAAIACGIADGLEPGDMGAAMLNFESVRGRMERLEMDLPFNVLIDYMHTEAAYEKGLKMVSDLTSGRVITVFGCGGDRDPSTRPAITGIVARLSYQAIATADNPRTESIDNIFKDMRSGNESCDNLSFIEDRRTAISMAIEMAKPGDTIVIAGKGHETFQEFSDCVVPFDDRAVAREILQNKQWQSR